jgi:rare lipoprotein A
LRRSFWLAGCAALLLITGCSHHAKTAYVPPPPSAAQNTYPTTAENQPASPNSDQSPETGETNAPKGKPIYSEVGIASWYGPPYNKRRGANGEIYDENAITAANRTLPLGSLVRVTNLQSGQSAMMRITDRGPFVPNRILDLSVGAAKAIGVWRAGVARVRVDVYEAPKPIGEGGRWCVQIVAFSHEGTAKKLQEHLELEYESSNVIEFAGPTGHWVRIRPENGDKRLAIEIVRNIHLAEGAAYLVRLD